MEAFVAWAGVALSGLGFCGVMVAFSAFNVTRAHPVRDRVLDEAMVWSAWAVVVGVLAVVLGAFVL